MLIKTQHNQMNLKILLTIIWQNYLLKKSKQFTILILVTYGQMPPLKNVCWELLNLLFRPQANIFAFKLISQYHRWMRKKTTFPWSDYGEWQVKLTIARWTCNDEENLPYEDNCNNIHTMLKQRHYMVSSLFILDT
jgi:hypothetical protein